MRVAQGQHGFSDLVAQGARVDDRHRQACLQVSVRLVHGGRAQNDHVRTIDLNGLHGGCLQQGKDLFFLARQQGLVVGADLNGPHRRAFVMHAQLIQRFFIQGLPAAGHGQDGKAIAQHERGQHGHLARPEHRDVKHRTQSRHARVTHGVDADRSKTFLLRAATGFKNRGIGQHKVMVAGVVHRTGLDRAVLKVQVRAKLQTLQLLLTKRQVVRGHGKGNDGQDFFHEGRRF